MTIYEQKIRLLNQYIIIWMWHQIFMYYDKVIFEAGQNNYIPSPPLLLDERTDQYMRSKLNLTLSIYPPVCYIHWFTV